MTLVLLVALLGGLLTSISPCVLPVLPVVLTAGASDRDTAETSTPGRSKAAGVDTKTRSIPWRPIWVVVGLVLSFSLSALLGSIVLSALHLPQDLLRNAGIAVLIIIGLSLIVPQLGDLIERPFARLQIRRGGKQNANGLVLGLGLGLLYLPCAGPILATIAVVGATHHVGWRSVLLTGAYGIGVGIPLLAFALAGDAMTRRVSSLRQRAGKLRIASGVIMLAFALAISFNLTDVLQRHVPGYVSAFQNKLEGSKKVSSTLADVRGGGKESITARTQPTKTAAATPADLGGKCTEGGPQLEDCGKAPSIVGINGWLNTQGDKPLSLKQLHGKVVLLDFWTYSCINCQRTLPHLEAWYSSYAKDGFEIIGVHTPEFAFEHVRSNIVSQAASLGVKYPIAIDNDYATWNNYGNQYWPAEYLIDAQGYIRHVSFGEGGYDTTEQLIRQLLHDAHPDGSLTNKTSVPTADVSSNQTGETYLGYQYMLHTSSGVSLTHDQAHTYSFPGNLDPDAFALEGEWTADKEDVVAGKAAKLELSYRANTTYLVLGGSGSVTVSIDGKRTKTVKVSGVPALYTLATDGGTTRHTMVLGVSKGVQAYDFTFG